MKKTLILMSALITVSASANPEQDIARVRVAMRSKVGISSRIGDVRLSVSKKEYSICGSSGNSIVAEFQVKNYEKGMDAAGNVVLNSKYTTVKTYGIAQADVSQLSDIELKSQIMDAEACLE